MREQGVGSKARVQQIQIRRHGITPEALAELVNDPNIVRIEYDMEMHAIIPIDLTEKAEKPKKPVVPVDESDLARTRPKRKWQGGQRKRPRVRRKLAQSVPWGISKIQADQIYPFQIPT